MDKGGMLEPLERLSVVDRIRDEYRRHDRTRLTRAAAAPDQGPTPETGQRLRSSVIDKLVLKGRLTREQADASDEIVLVQEIFGRGLTMSGGENARSGVVHHGIHRSVLERMTLDEERILKRVYRPWMQEVGTRPVFPDRELSALDLVLAVAVERHGVWQLDRSLGLRNGTTTKTLQNVLQVYVEIAGWMS